MFRRVLFRSLDNGDILQGQPTVYYANFVDTTGQHIVSKIMNYVGYDAASIGNHDIEAGPRVYDQLVEDFAFPWLSANIIDIRTGLPYFEPYTVITKNDVKVAIIGLSTPGVPRWLPKSLWPNMEFVDMVEAAKAWMDTIRVKEKPHIIIGLFHSGHNASYEGADPNSPMNENASLLVAQEIPGFDAVLIGHDHDRINKKIINVAGDSVLILDPGARGRLVSDVTFTIKLDSNNKLVSKKSSGNLVNTQGLMPDPSYVGLFSSYTREVEEFVDRRIGSIASSISTRDAYFGPSAFVNLTHSAQLGITNCDVSFAAPLSFDAQIEQGNIYVRDMFKLYSYENLLYIMKLTGQEIKDYLEYSYGLWFKTMASEDDNILLFRTDDEGNIILHNRGRAILKSSFYNFDSAAGIRYQVDVSMPAGERISIVSMEDGTPFSLGNTYRVAINSYRGAGGGGHLTEGVGLTKEELGKRVLSTSSHDMRHYLWKWIERSGRINPSKPNNWEIVPYDWAEKAIKMDRFLLFGEE